MNDLGGGIHVGNVDDGEWEKDDEVGGLVQVLFEDGGSTGGLWAMGPDPHHAEGHVLPARETIVILAGTVRIDIDGGPTLELGPGDIASMPKGATTTWHPSADFKEVWLYS